MAITFLSLLVVFVLVPRETIEDFATDQTDYEVIDSLAQSPFVGSIYQRQLHQKMFETAIQAKDLGPRAAGSDKPAFAGIRMWQFDFETSEKREEATDSLLRCFPEDCARIERQIDQALRIAPSIWVFTDRNIYVAQTGCQPDDEKWTIFKREFADTFADKDSDIIVTDCSQLTWTTKEQLLTQPDK